jgi:hypothetical protein
LDNEGLYHEAIETTKDFGFLVPNVGTTQIRCCRRKEVRRHPKITYGKPSVGIRDCARGIQESWRLTVHSQDKLVPEAPQRFK